MNNSKVLEFASEARKNGKKVALISITETNGASPASLGQVMAVSEEGEACGTVGGGASENAARLKAVEAMKRGESFFTFSFDLAESGMICGGSISGFGNVFGIHHRLVIFGGGHISRCVAPIAVTAGFSVTVVEERQEMESFFSNVEFIQSLPQEYSQNVKLDNKTYVVICTHGHTQDQAALEFCLKHDLPYVGMIGSKKKVAAIFENLGISGEKVHAPIGLDIAREIPGEIAVAIVAEILSVKNRGRQKTSILL